MTRLPTRLLLICGLLTASSARATPPATPSTRPSASQPAVKVVSVRELLRDAVDQYQRSDFDAARRILQDLAAHVGKDSTREAQQVHTYLGLVHVAFGKTDAAVASFERALAIDSNLSLPTTSPKITLVLDQARRRHRDKIHALDHDPPRLRHVPPKNARYGTRVTIEAETIDQSAIKDVTLSYRTRGDLGWVAIKMERKGNKHLASIPRLAVVRPGIEYFIEAWDALGNGPGLKGSQRAPIRVGVSGGPARQRLVATKPWYRKWWVWALVGGAVVTAAGVTTAAVLGRSEVGRIDIDIDSALNPRSEANTP